jgi:hypothetical protein
MLMLIGRSYLAFHGLDFSNRAMEASIGRKVEIL